MALKKRKDDGGGSSDWLGTYADMVTLLLTFFILLFSMSSVDAEKFEMLIKAFQSNGNETQQIVVSPEGEGSEMGTNQGEGGTSSGDETEGETIPVDFEDLYQYIKNYVEENNLSGSVDVMRGENNVFIRFRDNIFFRPNSAVLQSGGTDILNFLGDCFKQLDSEILAIRINGHTATVPNSVKTPGFDRTLSTDRANKVLIYLEEKKHIDPKKLIAIGYGRNYPVATNDTEDGRSKNRRVEMMIMSNNINKSGSDMVKSLLQGDYDVDMFKDSSTNEKVLVPDEFSKDKAQNDKTPAENATNTTDNAQNSTQNTNNSSENSQIEKNVSPYNQ